MKKILLLVLALLTMGSQLEISAAKEKKEGTGLKWEWDGTKSGNETIDNYLVQIDTLYRNLQDYQNSVNNFTYKADTIEIDGKPYILAWMIDTSTKKIVSRGRVNWEFANAIMKGTSIILDMTNAGLGSAAAATALPGLGVMKAVKFAKYVKGGPTVISEGIKAIKVVRGNYATDYKQWKGLKTGAVEDPSKLNIEGIDIDEELVRKLNKCCYLTEIQETDPSYQQIIEVLKGKTDEEKANDAQTALREVKESTEAEEDAKRVREDASDDAFMKALKG